jgi:hypothetical protein
MVLALSSVAQENQPFIVTPFNNQVISSEAELRSTAFTWTGTNADFVMR